MKPCRWLTAAVAALSLSAVLTPRLGAEPLTLIYLLSEPGDYIGGGREYYRDDTNGTFAIPQASDRDGDGLIDYVVFSWQGDQLGEFTILQFGTNRLPGTDFAPDFYDDAQRAPFAGDGHPGLDVSMDGRGCNTVTGYFTLADAEFDYSVSPPRVVSFAIYFEQHCEGLPPALCGVFYYNYDPYQ